MLFYVGIAVLFSKYLYHKAHATKFSALQQSQAHFSHALVWQQPNPVDVTSPTSFIVEEAEISRGYTNKSDLRFVFQKCLNDHLLCVHN